MGGVFDAALYPRVYQLTSVLSPSFRDTVGWNPRIARAPYIITTVFWVDPCGCPSDRVVGP
jgi:hypothetical protein